jgi:hypothetical protein
MGKKSCGLITKTAKMGNIPVDAPLRALPSKLSLNSRLRSMGHDQQLRNSDSNHSVSEPRDTRNLEIHLNYTADSSENSLDKPFLPRVPAVPRDLNRLAYSRDNKEQERPSCFRPFTPKRRSTFDLFETTVDQEAAVMSTEKASNPKDKLEGMYEGRV